MKFLDVKTDLAFKKVFASEGSKDILISFLNALLYKDKDKYITDLTVVDPYTIPLIKGMKDTFVDVKAILNNGTKVIIEMQVLNHESFEQRILYNAAKKYGAQLKKGDQYHLLNPVIALTIADFNLFSDHGDLISCYKLFEKNNLTEYTANDIELIFIELPKFVKSEDELETVQDKWLYFIKNAGNLDYTPQYLNQELAEAYQIANEANFTESELDLQHKKQEWTYIQRFSIELGIKQGIKQGVEEGLKQGMEQGIEQGMEQGKEEGVRDMVIKMQKKSLSLEVIADISGLSIDDIKLIFKK